MGCYTIYVTREHDGSLWWNGSKWGGINFASADELLGHLDTLERLPARDEPIPPAWCQGWFVDRGRRFARVYSCPGRAYESFLHERRLRASAGFHGWDVGIAWERAFEVAALAGSPVDDDEHFERLDGWAGCTEAGLLTRYVDPARFAYRWNAATEELWHEWYFDHGGVDITVIDSTGRVRDYGFEDCGVLFEALGHGTRLLDALRDVPPCPGVVTSYAGAVIDEQERSIRFWIERPVAPRTIAELRRRWPGFTVERERAGLAGHLQRTGRVEELHEQSGWPEPAPPYPPADPPRALRFIHARTVPAGEIAPEPIAADEARLLAAVYADPTSDAPRHAYAELLLSRGDRRGALIQVQCELRRLVRAGERSARRRSLEAKEARLVRWYGRAVVPGAYVRRFGRGFIEAVSVSDVTTLAVSEILRDFPTIEEVEITSKVGPADIRDLADVPAIARLSALSLLASTGSVSELSGSALAGRLRRLVVRGLSADLAAELRAALSAGHFGQLEDLQLSGEHVGDGGARVLAAGPIDALTSLALYSAGIGDAGAEALAASGHLAGLVSLDLAGNPIHERGAAALIASASLAGLRDLGLDNCPIDDAAIRHLAAMPELSRLRSLSLCRCGITAEGVLALAGSPHVSHLDELVISRLGGPRLEYELALGVLRDRLGDVLALR